MPSTAPVDCSLDCGLIGWRKRTILGAIIMHSIDIEIDLIEMTVGCAEQCSHCSESPDTGVRHGEVAVLLDAVQALVQLEAKLEEELFGHYWYPFPASDPLAYPSLFDLCHGIWRRRALPVYLLSLGWNRSLGAQTARRFCERPNSVFRIAITVSNFSRLAKLNPERHRERLAASLNDLRPLWTARGPDGKPLVLLSPQYIEHSADSILFSESCTFSLLEDICRRVRLPLRSWLEERRVFPRPVTGLGRAVTELDITASDEYSITAEQPCPPISKHPERHRSGLVARDGSLAVLPSPRGLLGRERARWQTLAGQAGLGVGMLDLRLAASTCTPAFVRT